MRISFFKEIGEQLYTKSKSSRGEFFWFLLGQFSILVSNFIVVKMLSKAGQAEFGFYTIIITVSAFISFMYYGPAQQSFLKFYYTAEAEGEKNIFTRLMSRFIVKSTVMFFLIGLAAALILTRFSETAFLLLLSSVLFITAGKYTEFFNSAFNILRHRKLNSILQFTERLLLALLIIALVLYREMTLLNALIIMALLSLIFALIKNYIFVKKNIPGPAEPGYKGLAAKHIKRIRLYALPFVIWGLSGWLQLNSEKWILAGVLSLKDVGIYGVMAVIVNMFVAVPANILNEFIGPVIFANYSDPSDAERLKKGKLYVMITFFLISAIAVASVLVSWSAGAWIITFFSSAGYASSYFLLPYFITGAGFFYAGQVLTTEGLALNRPEIYIAPKIVGGAAGLAANYFFIRAWGLPGAAYAAFFSGVFYMAYIIFTNRKLHK